LQRRRSRGHLYGLSYIARLQRRIHARGIIYLYGNVFELLLGKAGRFHNDTVSAGNEVVLFVITGLVGVRLKLGCFGLIGNRDLGILHGATGSVGNGSEDSAEYLLGVCAGCAEQKRKTNEGKGTRNSTKSKHNSSLKLNRRLV